jgi:hypothetical protein
MKDAQALTRICRSGVSLNEKDSEGNGILHVAVESGSEDLVEIIVEHYKDEPTYLDEANAAGQSAVFVAARLGDERVMLRLLQAHCDPTKRDKTGFTPLHVACLFGHFEISKQLIARGCDAFTYDSIHQSPASIVERGWNRCANEIKRLQHLSKEVRTEALNKGLTAQPAFQEWFLRKHSDILRRYFNRRACELGMALHHSNVEVPLEELEAEDDAGGADEEGGSLQASASAAESDNAAGQVHTKKDSGDGTGSDSDSDSDDESKKSGSARLGTGAESPPETPAHHRDPTAKEYFHYVATRKLTAAQEAAQAKDVFDASSLHADVAEGADSRAAHELHHDGETVGFRATPRTSSTTTVRP